MIQEIPINQIDSNPFQPRTQQDETALEALAADIAARGLIQPPVGRWVDGRVQLACGHRRVEACRRLGWEAIPVDIRDLSDQEIALMAWSENEARENLNPLDRAKAIRRMMETFGWTQEQAAKHLGLARPTIANILRLLSLRPEVQAALAAGRISERQALALAPLSDLKSWDVTKGWVHKRIAELLAGEKSLSSDEIRKLMRDAAEEASRLLQEPPWGFGDDPDCEQCQSRKRNRCYDLECFDRKADQRRRQEAERVAGELELPVAEEEVRVIYAPGLIEVAREKRCPHIRVVPDKFGFRPAFGCALGSECECIKEVERRSDDEREAVRQRKEHLEREIPRHLLSGLRDGNFAAWRAFLLGLIPSYEHETVNSVSSMDGALELLVQRATRGLIGLYYLSDVRQAIESLLGNENVTM